MQEMYILDFFLALPSNLDPKHLFHII